MAHSQKTDYIFRLNGRVQLKRLWLQFSRLLAAEVCASMVVMLHTPCSEVVWRVLATHCIRLFPLHFTSRESPCAITFQLDSTSCLDAVADKIQARSVLTEAPHNNNRPNNCTDRSLSEAFNILPANYWTDLFTCCPYRQTDISRPLPPSSYIKIPFDVTTSNVSFLRGYNTENDDVILRRAHRKSSSSIHSNSNMAAINNIAFLRLITLSTAITRCHVISLRYELQAQSYIFELQGNF